MFTYNTHINVCAFARPTVRQFRAAENPQFKAEINWPMVLGAGNKGGPTYPP